MATFRICILTLDCMVRRTHRANGRGITALSSRPRRGAGMLRRSGAASSRFLLLHSLKEADIRRRIQISSFWTNRREPPRLSSSIRRHPGRVSARRVRPRHRRSDEFHEFRPEGPVVSGFHATRADGTAGSKYLRADRRDGSDPARRAPASQESSASRTARASA